MILGDRYTFAYKHKVLDGINVSVNLYKCVGGLTKKDGNPLKELMIKGQNLPERCNVLLKADEGTFDLSGTQPVLNVTRFHLLDRPHYFAEPLYCKFNKVIFYNDTNGYTVAKYDIVNHNGFKDPDGHFMDSVVCIGYFIPVEKVVNITFESGDWKKSKMGDWQIEIKEYDLSLPDDEEGCIKYLSALDGCGPTTAQKIFNKFGLDCYDILENEPEKIAELPRVSIKHVKKMQEAHLSVKPAREIIQFLGGYGITVLKSLAIYRFYTEQGLSPEQIMNMIRMSPFELTSINGFGFRTADNIAKSMKLNNLSRARLRNAIIYMMEEDCAAGHVFSYRNTLIKNTCRLLNDNAYPNQERSVTAEDVNKTLSEMITLRLVYKEINEEIYLTQNYYAEMTIARRIVQLLKAPASNQLLTSSINSLVLDSIRHFGYKEAEKQQEAAVRSLENKVSIITGGPGTGKTSIIKIILDVYQKNFPQSEIRLCAPTGRAAQRMSESTGERASTIHRLLNLNSRRSIEEIPEDDDEEQNNPIKNVDLLIIDECSMIDIYLMKTLLEMIPDHARVIFVGDAFQLPSIGPGAVFNDLIKSTAVPTTILDKIFRQEGVTKIAVNAARIKAGLTDPLYLQEENEFEFVEVEGSLNCEQVIIDRLQEELDNLCEQYNGDKQKALDNIHVLVPTRKEKVVLNPETGKKDYDNIKLRCNATTLNRDIQKQINPLPNKVEKSDCISYVHIGSGEVAKKGDKVMQIKNDYDIEVFNGDIGYITNIIPSIDNPHEYFAEVFFTADNRTVTYGKDKLKELTLSYSSTIHKAQGSEYDTVIIGITSEHYALLRRNIIYTAITRAKKKVIIIGSKKFYAAAISKIETDKRNTHLANRVLIMFNDITCPDRSVHVLPEMKVS